MASPTPTAPAPVLSQAAVYAERAIGVMRSLGVMPLPKHYAVFFAYVAGQPSGLLREIELLKSQRQRFSDEVMDVLYNRFIAEEQTRVVNDTAVNAKKILTEMMNNVSAFAGATSAISADVSRELKLLDEQASEEVVRLLANTLVSSAEAMQNSSDTMQQRLAGAQQEIADLKEDLARVMTEAERDFLTGCFNRKAFDKRLLDAVEDARAKSTELSLLMIDIDHFKQFNDNFGHLIGDEELKIVARTLTDTLKGMDCVARYGGEEFAVILPRTPLGGGMVVAEAIRKSIASRELKRKTNGENFGAITISVGVARYRHGDDTPESLIRRADEAMYQSKKNGRNRVSQELPPPTGA